MTKEQKIEAIYEAMADTYEVYQGPDSAPEIDIIPVRIGDVLDFLYTRDGWDLRDVIFSKWYQLRLPIDDQPEECIDYIFDLIK